MTRMGIVRGIRAIGLLGCTTPSIATAVGPIGVGAVGGWLTALALAPQSIWPLAWIGLIPLWLAIMADRPQGWQGPERASSERAGLGRAGLGGAGLGGAGLRGAGLLRSRPLLTALAWGLAYYGWALRWVTGLHPLTWLGLPWWVSLAVTGLCWAIVVLWGAFQGVIWMAVMGQVARLVASPFLRIAWGALLWCGLDWLWSLSPLYWPPLALTQSPGNPAILHLAQWSGPNLITLAIVSVNGCWAWAWLQGGDRRWRWLGLGLGLALALHGIGALLWSRPLADRPDQALTLGIIQGNIPTREKLTPEGIALGRDRYAQAYGQLAQGGVDAGGVDAVLLPEGALPYIWADQSRTDSPLYQAIVSQQIPALVGAFGPSQAGPAAHDRGYTQSLFVIDGQGRQIGRYNKVKLVLLGEYIPKWLANVLGRLSPISAAMEFGASQQRVQSPWGPIAVAICYEPAFSAVLRDQVAAGARFGVTSSNLDPYGPVLMAQHQAQDSLRAIETDRWIARASNTGYSGTIDPHGQVHGRPAPNQVAILRQTLYRRQGQTAYVRWGDRLTPALALVILGLTLVQSRTPSRTPAQTSSSN
jgi:apolipoprotein N-acyltransferase